MQDINKVHLTGRIARDPDMRTTNGGLTILNFSVAVNHRSKDKVSGKYEDVGHFFDCRMFGKYADTMAGILGKGHKVVLEGHLQQDSWQDKETGKNRSKVAIAVDQIQDLTPKDHTDPYERDEEPNGNLKDGYTDSDIPF